MKVTSVTPSQYTEGATIYSVVADDGATYTAGVLDGHWTVLMGEARTVPRYTAEHRAVVDACESHGVAA